MNILLKNCKLTNHKIVDILIQDQKIIQVDSQMKIDKPIDKIYDINQKLVMPGMIDIHTHMRDLNLSHKEDYQTGSYACLANGITTFFDMPNSNPTTTNLANQAIKLTKIKTALTNAYTYIGLDQNSNYEEVKAMLKYAKGIKIFLNESTGKMNFDLNLIDARIFELNTLYLFHAENDSILDIANIIKNKQARIHICHLSSKKEYENYLKLKQQYPNTSFEVAPHHLWFNNQSIADENFAMVKPGLKDVKDQQFLLELFRNKQIMCIASDHAPHTIEEKNQGSYGFPGVEVELKLLFELCKKFEIGFDYIEKIFASNPAKIAGLEKVGKIEKAYDADLIVVDEITQKVFQQNDIMSKCNWSPYLGMTFDKEVIMTFIKGELKYER